MKLRPGHWIAAGVLLAAVAIIVGANLNAGRARKGRPPGPARREELPARTQLEIGNLQLNDRDPQGNLRWQIKSSGKIDLDRAKMLARGTDIRWELLRANQETMLLSAPEFTMDYPGKKVSLNKGVTAKSSGDGMAFEAQQVDYDMAAEHLRALGPVTAHFADYQLKADALDLNRLSQTADLSGAVKLRYRDYEATGQTLVVNTGQRHALLSGEPEVRRGAYVARAAAIEVDGLKQEARLHGGARLTRGSKLSARAPEAVLGKLTERAEMRGGVTLAGEGFTATGRSLAVDGARTVATLSGAVHVKTSVRW